MPIVNHANGIAPGRIKGEPLLLNPCVNNGGGTDILHLSNEYSDVEKMMSQCITRTMS